MSVLRLSALGLLLCSAAMVPAYAETVTVIIEKMAFVPAQISVRVGDTIKWINKDAFAHTATVQGHWEVMLPVGESGSIAVDNAQDIEYFCRFHPNMKGRITVTAP